MFFRFLHWKVILSTLLFPYWPLWKELSIGSPPIRSGELHSTSMRAQYVHTLLGIFLHRRFVKSPIHLFIIHSFNQIFTSLWIYEYSFYTLNYNPILFYLLLELSYLWPAGALNWLLYSINKPNLCFCVFWAFS